MSHCAGLGKLQYLIEWKDYEPKERWIPAHDVLKPYSAKSFMHSNPAQVHSLVGGLEETLLP